MKVTKLKQEETPFQKSETTMDKQPKKGLKMSGKSENNNCD